MSANWNIYIKYYTPVKKIKKKSEYRMIVSTGTLSIITS